VAVLRLVTPDTGARKIEECAPVSFEELGLKERQDIEEWLVATPSVVDPALVVISSEYDAFAETKERIDILGALPGDPGEITLVVVELKRHGSSTTADLQAIKYAAYVSTLDFDALVDEYARFWKLDQSAGRNKLRSELGVDADADDPTVGNRPSIVLVATDFRPEITATVLWLQDEVGLDLRCVQLTAHRVGDETVLSTQTILPLPAAEEFRIGRRAKKQAESGAKKAAAIDPVALRTLMDRLPAGRWTSYGAVARVLGSPGAGLGVGARLRHGDYPNAHRVLISGGRIAPRFTDGEGGGPEVALTRLRAEGLKVGDDLIADQDAKLTDVQLQALLKGTAEDGPEPAG
jgi:alkylated DNA nucleotide flippase Atl1